MIAFVLAAGIIAFLFLFFAFKLDDGHFILKVLLIFFFLITILIIPRGLVEEPCELTIASELQNITGNITNIDYTYETTCYNSTNVNDLSNENNLLKIPLWFFRLFVIYFSIFMVYHWFKKSELMMRIFHRQK